MRYRPTSSLRGSLIIARHDPVFAARLNEELARCYKEEEDKRAARTEAAKLYAVTQAGRRAQSAYRASKKGKAWRARYKKSERGKQAIRDAMKRYRLRARYVEVLGDLA